MEKGPLSHLKVIELASVLAGPSVGQFFAELGADVIKIENIRTKGDVTRSWLGTNEKENDEGISAYFSCVNWGKKSLAIDLSREEGKAIVHQLVVEADVVIASFKSGDDHKLGVDYDTLKQLNEGIIYGHITGYGPNIKKTGYDAVVQAESGFMYMNGEPGGASLKMPVALIDILAAHHLKEGILLALLKRGSSGNGEYVHVSLFDAALASLANQATNWLVANNVPSKMGQEHPNIAPYGKTFTTKDGKAILLAIGTDSQFQKLCIVLNIESIGTNKDFATNKTRVKNRVELNRILENAIKDVQSTNLIDQLNSLAIPSGVINPVNDVFSLEGSTDMLLSGPLRNHRMKGIRNTAFSIGLERFGSETPSPPAYGQHSHEVLSNVLGYSAQKIQALIQNSIVA